MATKFSPSIGSPVSPPRTLAASFWGDSRTYQNWSFNDAVPITLASGQYWWLEAISQSVRLNVRSNFGVPGDRVADLYYRMVNDVPNAYGIRPSKVPPGLAFLLIGTNDSNGALNRELAGESIQVQLLNCVLWLRQRGHVVFLISETPRGDSVANTILTEDLPVMLRYRDYCKTLSSMDNVFVVNPWTRMCDYSRSDGRPQEGFLNVDGLHFSGAAGFVIGEELAENEFIRSLPKFDYAPESNADQWSTSYPRGCINLNPMLVQGAGGTIGANAAGVAPVNYTLLTNDAGITATGSFVTTTYKGKPRPAFRIVVAGTTTAENSFVSLRQTGLLGTKIAAGNRAFAGFECVVASGHQNFCSPSLMLDPGITTSRIWGGASITAFRGFPSQAVKSFEAMPLTIEENVASAAASLMLDIRIQFADTASATALTIDLISAFVRRPQ